PMPHRGETPRPVPVTFLAPSPRLQYRSPMLATDFPEWYIRILALVVGALFGSFFNVAIYRWPREMSVVSPPSHCPSCGAPVKPRQNVPIFGYLLLRGRAKCCGAPLSPRYLVVELLGAVLGLAVAEHFFVNAAWDRSA